MLIILTLASTFVALVMSGVAWRATRDARRRSEARVAVLAEAIHSGPAAGELPIRPAAPATASLLPGAPPRGPARERLFEPPAQPGEGASRWGVALAAGALAVATIGAAAIVFSGESPSAAVEPRGTPPPAEGSSAPAAPLELLTLVHELDGAGLTVRGLVRNPSSGSSMNGLTAVVSLFDHDGGPLTTSSAALSPPVLAPGTESTFMVTVPAAGNMGRYRVSFRTGEHVVSHVDKRGGS